MAKMSTKKAKVRSFEKCYGTPQTSLAVVWDPPVRNRMASAGRQQPFISDKSLTTILWRFFIPGEHFPQQHGVDGFTKHNKKQYIVSFFILIMAVVIVAIKNLWSAGILK